MNEKENGERGAEGKNLAKSEDKFINMTKLWRTWDTVPYIICVFCVWGKPRCTVILKGQ
jgi:hypothetical protein